MEDLSRIFGNFYKIVEDKNKYTGTERKGLSSVFIFDGRIQGSDGHVYVSVPVENWVDEQDGREHLEGRAIHYTVLKEIVKKKYKRIVFTKHTIEAYTTAGVYNSFGYSAIKDGDKWYQTDGEDFILDKGNKIVIDVPVYSQVIPTSFEHTTNFVRLNPDYLVAIQECFASSKYYGGVQIEFSEPSKSGASRPMKVTPVGGMYTNSLSEEWAIIMPIL